MNENELLKEITCKINWQDIALKLEFEKQLFNNGLSFVECITWLLWKRILSKTNNEAIIEYIENVYSYLKKKDFSFDDLPLEILKDEHDHDTNENELLKEITSKINWENVAVDLGFDNKLFDNGRSFVECITWSLWKHILSKTNNDAIIKYIENGFSCLKSKDFSFDDLPLKTLRNDYDHDLVDDIQTELLNNEFNVHRGHININQNNGLLLHHHMSAEKIKPFPISTEKHIAVNIGGGGVKLVHYQDYKDFMKTRADYFKLSEMFSDIRTFDFTTSDQKKCQVLNSIRCYLEQSKCDGFGYKGYSFRNHYTLFGEYVVPQEEVNNNILAYFSNDIVLIHIKTCDNIKDISRTLNSCLQDVQFAQAVHKCVCNNPIIHIGVVLADDNILNDSHISVCYQCVKNCLVLPKSTFSTEEGFGNWYDNVIKLNKSSNQIKNTLNSINQKLKVEVSTELKRNIICQMALKSFDFPSFTSLTNYQMEEIEKIVLTASEMEVLHSPHKHIVIKGSYGSGKSLVLHQRFKQALQESSNNDIFYLICHDSMSKYATQMELMSKHCPEKLILVCNSQEISKEEWKISDLLRYIRETWKSRRVHIYIDEFNGQHLDKDEVYKIKEEMRHFKGSHIVIAVQSMEYTFYEKSNLSFMKKDGISFQFQLLAKETSFGLYQIEYSLRCSVEISTFVKTITNYLGDEYLNFVNEQNACDHDRTTVDRELTIENLMISETSYKSETYYKYKYNTPNNIGHNVCSGKVNVYSLDQDLLLKSKICVKIILYHLLTCIQDKVVVSTFDEGIYKEVCDLLVKSKCNWSTDIDGFIRKNSSFQVLLTDYASMRGFEFTNVIFLLGSDRKLLKYRLAECLTRATKCLSLVSQFSVHELIGLFNSSQTSNILEHKVLCFDHSQDIYYFRSNDESEKEFLVRNVHAECEGSSQFSSRYPWPLAWKNKSIIDQADDLQSTIELIFKQDNVKLFEDLVHLHSINVSKYKIETEGNLLHLAAKYNASKLCTLVCNQYKELVNSYDNYQYTPLEVTVRYDSDLVATVLIKHGAQVNIQCTSSTEISLHKTTIQL